MLIIIITIIITTILDIIRIIITIMRGTLITTTIVSIEVPTTMVQEHTLEVPLNIAVDWR